MEDSDFSKIEIKQDKDNNDNYIVTWNGKDFKFKKSIVAEVVCDELLRPSLPHEDFGNY